MIRKSRLGFIVTIAALGLALPTAALSQSAYTSGTVAGNEAAGYPSPYGYASGLYAYVVSPEHSHAPRWQSSRSRHATAANAVHAQ
jgi:hypothetical protein